MKLALKFSVLGNVVLLAMVSLLVGRLWLINTNTIDTTGTRAVFTTPASSISYGASEPAMPARSGFSWRQIESTDYRTYLGNLRAIGCPEQTVRDIIRADVHDLYAKKRTEVGLDESSSSSRWSVAEEERLVMNLLGSALEQPLIKSSVTSGAPVLPLVLRDLDPAVLHLDQEHQAAVAELRSQFVTAIGGTNQNVTDPAYAKRWQESQPESDRLLRGMIGVNAFMQYQNEAE